MSSWLNPRTWSQRTNCKHRHTICPTKYRPSQRRRGRGREGGRKEGGGERERERERGRGKEGRVTERERERESASILAPLGHLIPTTE
jgi:hypothetical protein